MKYKKLLCGRALYTQEDKIWVARGMCFWAVDYNGKRVTDCWFLPLYSDFEPLENFTV